MKEKKKLKKKNNQNDINKCLGGFCRPEWMTYTNTSQATYTKAYLLELEMSLRRSFLEYSKL